MSQMSVTHPKVNSRIRAQFPDGRMAEVVYGGADLGWAIINQSLQNPIVDKRIVRWRYLEEP